MDLDQFESVEDLIHSDLFKDWVFLQQKQDFWSNWQQENIERQKMIIEAKQILQKLSFEQKVAPEMEINLAFNNVWSSIEKAPNASKNQIPQPKSKEIRLHSFKFWRIAAAFLVLIIFSGLGYYHFLNPFKVYKTEYGETKTIQLPDQSKVVLQANSSLKILKEWSQDREVWLEGEAFFSVNKKQAASPIKFIVHTGDFQVQVLGTQFNVLNRAKHKRVVLKEGQIKMKLANKEEINLQPNEMVSLDIEANQYQKTPVNAQVHTAWIDQKLILNNTSLLEVTRILEENYGYEIQFSSQVNKNEARSTLGAIPYTNLSELIALIEGSYDVNITERDKLINIKIASDK